MPSNNRAPQNEVVNQDADGATWSVYRHKISENLPVDVQLATLAKWYGRWISRYATLGPAWLADIMALRFRAMQAVDANAPTFKRVIIRGRICTDELAETEWDYSFAAPSWSACYAPATATNHPPLSAQPTRTTPASTAKTGSLRTRLELTGQPRMEMVRLPAGVGSAPRMHHRLSVIRVSLEEQKTPVTL
jgi:hypothetical protein